MCKESLINDENWKNAYTKGYVLSLIIGGARSPLLKYWGGASGPPGPPCSYSTGNELEISSSDESLSSNEEESSSSISGIPAEKI